jgi:hypothetical protein
LAVSLHEERKNTIQIFSKIRPENLQKPPKKMYHGTYLAFFPPLRRPLWPGALLQGLPRNLPKKCTTAPTSLFFSPFGAPCGQAPCCRAYPERPRAPWSHTTETLNQQPVARSTGKWHEWRCLRRRKQGRRRNGAPGVMAVPGRKDLRGDCPCLGISSRSVVNKLRW